MAGKKMSSSSWKKQLSASLTLAARNPDNRVAFIGIGSELHGDDVVGIEAIRRLRRRLRGHENFALIEGGTLPESCTGPLRRFAPHKVVIVDAADFGGKPGELRWLDPTEISGYSGSTHTFPIGLFAKYIHQDLGCEVHLLGIQPKSIEFGTSLSPEVQKALRQLIQTIGRVIKHPEQEISGSS